VSTTRARRFAAVLREEERVTPLELFFDLVFVLAITQCTALMAAEPTYLYSGVYAARPALRCNWTVRSKASSASSMCPSAFRRVARPW
jgi:low temperature requirement A protein (LtrA)